MNVQAIHTGDQVKAISDRILLLPEKDLVLWTEGDVLTVQGVVDHDNYREFLIRIDADNWESVPGPIMEELFIVQ